MKYDKKRLHLALLLSIGLMCKESNEIIVFVLFLCTQVGLFFLELGGQCDVPNLLQVHYLGFGQSKEQIFDFEYVLLFVFSSRDHLIFSHPSFWDHITLKEREREKGCVCCVFVCLALLLFMDLWPFWLSIFNNGNKSENLVQVCKEDTLPRFLCMLVLFRNSFLFTKLILVHYHLGDCISGKGKY